MGKKSAENLVAAIDQRAPSGSGPLAVRAGIRHVGETTARDVARHFGSMERIMDASGSAAGRARRGRRGGGSIRRFFAEPHNREIVEQLTQQGVHPQAEAEPEGTSAWPARPSS